MKKRNLVPIILVITCSLLAVVVMMQKSNKEGQATFPSIAWDCSEIQADSFRLKRLMSDFRIIPLEYTDKSIMGNIDKVIVADSLVFVMDSQGAKGIFVFDLENGKLIRKIGAVGNGYGEYNQLYDVSIDSDNRNIYVLCERKRLLCYSFSGKFLSVKDLPFVATNFEYLDGKFYFINDMPDEDNLCITDSDCRILASAFPNNVYGGNYRRLIHPLQKTSDGILYHRFLDQSIYMIDKDNEISPLYTLKFGDEQLSMEDVQKMSREELKEWMAQGTCHIKYFTEGQDYSVALFFREDVPYISIYDKKREVTETYEYSKMKNDLMNLNFPLLEFVTPENRFMTVLYHEDIEALMEQDLLDKETYGQNSNPMLCIFQ